MFNIQKKRLIYLELKHEILVFLKNLFVLLGATLGQVLAFVNQVMQGPIAIDLVRRTPGARIVEMFVIVRIMRFAMVRMEDAPARQGILEKSMYLSNTNFS